MPLHKLKSGSFKVLIGQFQEQGRIQNKNNKCIQRGEVFRFVNSERRTLEVVDKLVVQHIK